MQRTAFLLFSAVALVGAAPREEPRIDLLTGMPLTPLEREPSVLPGTPPPAVQAQPGKRILWDLTHGVYQNYEPADRFSQAVAVLAADGFTVDTTSVSVATIDLSSWDILVVGIGSCFGSAYTAAEVSAIQTFVSSGGGLLIMGDGPAAWPQNIDPVAQAFGTNTAVADIDPDDLVFGTFLPHPIFEDVHRIYYRAAGALQGQLPSKEVAFTPASEPVVNVVRGSLVVVTGDINAFDNTYLGSANNVRFLRNVFDYLSSRSG
jgi:hypothetical protein